jgi:uncharacterized protein YjdB
MKKLNFAIIVTLIIMLALGGAVSAQDSPVPVEDVTLSRTTLSLVVGGQPGVLRANITPLNSTNQNVTWTSSNISVATVVANSDAVVTAVAPGTATITATTEDGGLSAECVVTVTAAASTPTPPTGSSHFGLILAAMGMLIFTAAVILRKLSALDS